MVTSINVAAPNPLLAYQTTPVAPVSAIPGSPSGTSGEQTTEQQSALEARIQNFEAYLNGGPTETTQSSATSASDTSGESPSQILTSYALTDLDSQIQNFEAYLNQQSSLGSQDSTSPTSPTSDDGTAALLGQLQALEAYAATQLTKLGSSQVQDTSTSGQSVAAPTGTSASNSPPPTEKPIDLGAVVNALERYLSKQGAIAISDPIQGQSSTPIPVYQTVQGRQDPLPVNGPEQDAKTSAKQSDTKHDTLNQDLNHLLEDLAILNLVANKKTLEFDPVRDLENRSTYKPPGESSPI